MIVDSLTHIETYKHLSIDIYVGLEFIFQAKPGIELGTYPINESAKAIVSSYDTVEVFTRGYESQRHVIDIQYPVIGLERVKWSPIDNMVVNIPYDKVKDRTFFKEPSPEGTHVNIGNGIFAIMFPHDGHSPQHKVGHIQTIKKITVKVSI